MRSKSQALSINPGVGGGGSLSDGDKGDITVSASGNLFTIDNSAVATAKIANQAVTLPKLANGTPGRLIGFDVSGVAAEVVGGGVSHTEVLTIVARNTINPLSFTPLSPVEFVINGIESSGVTNVGMTVSVNPTVVGFNIDPIADRVTAQYLR